MASVTHLDEICLSLLVDNSRVDAEFEAEHGFSCLIETDNKTVLFDTGAATALARNCATLNLGLERLDALVLSHGHYDHTGGLASVSHCLHASRIIAHPNIFGSHRSRRTGIDRDIGMPELSRRYLESLSCELSTSPTEVIRGIWTTGEIPQTTGSRNSNHLFVDSQGLEVDTVPDDLALILRHREGLILLLGCAHAGVIDTAEAALRLFPEERILGVIGGMHLDGAEASTIETVCGFLERSPATFIIPAHCTGEQATQALASRLGNRFIRAYSGRQFKVNRLGQIEDR